MRFAKAGLLGLVAALGLSGCATFAEGSRQLIAISTPPTQGAQCLLTRPGDHWMVTTPGVIRVDKSIDDIAIRCSRPGFRDAAGTIPADVDIWTLGNAAVGVIPAGVDAATGAMFSYPNEFALPMTPGGNSIAPQPFVPPPDLQPSSPPPVEEPPPPQGPALPGTLPQNF